ncbi:hypothetical protein GCM10018962_46100 [Dactylosporangium matsuzakiense]|uniref:Uncharacterized protein n=1 Tax=Dactylosporangium matsuzakiense TaxID=53360 RepID=A0A9W6KPI8_9ACTN|nr:hypothetical protein GCM10017581_067000 [Dactylosporangium matsuzakiense]
MPGVQLRRLAVTALAVTPTPLVPIAPLPPGLVWVGQAPGVTGSTLHTATGPIRLRYSLNAMACGRDGLLTALATELDGRRLPDAPHLVRVTTAGAVTDLGPAPGRRDLATGYGAAMATAADGSTELLVTTGDRLRPLRLSPGPPAPLASHALPDLPYAGDWAIDPRTGELVTVVSMAGAARVVRLRWDAATGVGAVDTTPVPALPPSSAYGGVAVLADGSIAAVFNRNAGPGAGAGTGRAPMGGALYRITGTRASKLADLGPLTSSDAATCPVPSPPPQPPVVARAVPTTPPPATAAVATPAPGAVAVRTTPPAKPPVRSRGPSPSPGAPGPTPSKQPAFVPTTVALAASEARHRIGSRYIPVVGALMVAAVAVARLVRRSRR